MEFQSRFWIALAFVKASSSIDSTLLLVVARVTLALSFFFAHGFCAEGGESRR